MAGSLVSRWRYYFAYGSNMLPARLLERTPSAACLGPACLPGHRLAFNHVSRGDGSAKCNIAGWQPGGDRVWGVVYALPEHERPVLDRAEDLGRGYLIENRRVEMGGDWVDVFCYVAVPGTLDDRVRPYRWYRDIVLAGARQHRFPESYIDAIAREVVIDDPDARRAARHRKLLQLAQY